ncbi:hypothetical protein Thivi_3608 [Thiocystis violascens DSM 198]|uniref:Uncharacterized protein n=1 Tax=Thiocystis violascens (strain ATCC 17096 / DSM 198 / 6111) TaxID=765911 RepID=I3YEP7_THIV6|nr:hypothetical protein Thivi_3608 [Thiocystis violascens DSM 198]
MTRSILVTVFAVGLACTAVPASAVVYCKTVGVPKGCVVRPVVVAPAVAAPVVVAPRVGRSPTNLNGGVNRAGVRR